MLAAFLKARLSCLGAGDRVQATMTAAWLTELYLDQINRALLEVGRVLCAVIRTAALFYFICTASRPLLTEPCLDVMRQCHGTSSP